MVALAAISRFRSEQADIAHVMLGAGVRTAREVDVHGLIEFDPLLEIFDELKRMTLGVG